MKLDAVLEASEFNSDFVAAFRARDEKWNYRFGPETIYASSHAGGGGFIRAARRFLHPVLKLFFNPNPIISALSRQADLNRYYVLLLHNMAQELTRANLELSNLKARLRTLGIRVDFQGKREKTMEQVVLEREPRDTRPLPRSSDRQEPSDRGERSDRADRPERSDRDRGGERRDRPERSDRGDRPERADRPDRADRERGERSGERGDREGGRGRGRGRRSFRRRRGGGGGGGGGNRGDAPGRPPGGGRPGGGSPGPREGSGGNRG